jgi:hypothetical protein
MNFRTIAIAGLFLSLNIFSLKGQYSIMMGYGQASKSVKSDVPIIVGKSSPTGFSTAELSKAFPKLNIPAEVIRINYPDMSSAADTLGIIWYLKPEGYSQSGEINIVLVGISPDGSYKYYVDNNNDRTYGADEDSFVFAKEEEKRILKILIKGSTNDYTLFNPSFIPPPAAPSRTGIYNTAWINSSKKPAIAFDFSISFGGGDAKLSYAPVASNINSYQYVANIFGAFKPNAGIDFSWYNFHITLSGAFERDQYASIMLYGYSNNFRSRYFDRGNWQTAKLHTSISAEYDIRILKFLRITPFASYSVYTNIDDKKFDRAIIVPPDARYKDMSSREAGLKLKVPTSEKSLIYLKVAFSKSWFDATEYLPSITEGTYALDYRQTFFGVGMQFRITKD